jgi:hypothetical protein
MASVDQVDLDTARFEEFEEGDPVDAGRFHGHRVHVVLDQPGGQAFQVGGEGREGARGLARQVRAQSHPNFPTADVNPSRVGMNNGQRF